MQRTAVFVLCSLALLLPSLSTSLRAQVDSSGSHWSSERLDLDVVPDFAHQSMRVSGRVTLRLDAGASSGPTLTLGHDLTPYFTSQTEFMRFARVTAGNATVTLNRPGAHVGEVLADVRFSRPKHAGDRVTVTFEVEMLRGSFTAVVTKTVAMSSGSTGWYPRPIGAPGSDWSAAIDATAGETRVHVPNGWSTIASGAFVARQHTAQGWTDTWRQDTQKSRSFVAGPYGAADRRIGGMEVRVLSLTPAMQADSLLSSLGSIMRTLSDRFGAYPYAKYAAAEFPDDAVRWWGIALGDFQILRTSLLTASNGGFSPLAHEIGHAWWGNKVIAQWPGGYMISEAMAGYSSLLALEGAFGRARYQQALHTPEPGNPPDYTLANHLKLVAEGKDVALSRQTEDGINYQLAMVKGVHVYHMLRQRVGDSIFFGTLRALQRAHAGRSLSLDQLRAAFVSAAPDLRLTAFFEQWLDRTGVPLLEADLSCTPVATGGFRTHVRVRQVQEGAAYELPVTVALTGEDVHSLTVPMTEKAAAAEVVARACYTTVELDPQHDLFITTRPASQGSNPADRALLSRAIGALLQADGPRTDALLDSVARLATDSAVRQAGDCMRDRMRGETGSSPSAASGLAERTLRLYRRYWARALAQPSSRDAQLDTLMSALRSLLSLEDTAETSRVEAVLGDTLSKLGIHSMRGRTGLLQELLLWRQERDTTYGLLLPEGPQNVRVVFLDGFESLGWSNYFTCNRAGTGGWTKPDGLFVVVPKYRSITDEAFRVNFLAHEGQHFADQRRFGTLEPWELEYRAKLVEIATADSTLASTLSAFDRSQGTDSRDAHAYANRRVLVVLRLQLGLADGSSLQGIGRVALAQAALRALAEDSRGRTPRRPDETSAATIGDPRRAASVGATHRVNARADDW